MTDQVKKVPSAKRAAKAPADMRGSGRVIQIKSRKATFKVGEFSEDFLNRLKRAEYGK